MDRAKFQTIVEIPKFGWKTGYTKKNIFIGSCFTENVGNKMESLKYDTEINPFGILYNPASVANSLFDLLENRKFHQNELIVHNGLWHSLYHHGKFSGTNPDEVVEQINSRISYAAQYLKNTDFLFLTFGTAWVYKFIKNDQIVSNCHKIPAKEFIRFRLSVDEIANEYISLLGKIRQQNSKIKVIFTVSPIRHWKDGAIENQRSKSTLLLAIDKIISRLGRDFCDYFPAYEIIMDELRDYRFYAEDMIHVTDVAVNHIWEIFQNALIEEDSIFVSEKVKKIVRAVNHKPFNKVSEEYLKFLNASLNQVNELEAQFPNLNFELEKNYFKSELDEIGQKIRHF